MFINIILWDPCCSYVLMLIPWDWPTGQPVRRMPLEKTIYPSPSKHQLPVVHIPRVKLWEFPYLCWLVTWCCHAWSLAKETVFWEVLGMPLLLASTLNHWVVSQIIPMYTKYELFDWFPEDQIKQRNTVTGRSFNSILQSWWNGKYFTNS